MTPRVAATASQSGIRVTEGSGSAFHLPLALWLDGPLDRDRLVAACHALPLRHPMLAATVETSDEGVFIVPAATPPPVRTVDVPQERVRTFLEEEIGLPLSGPLSRFTLARLAPGRHVLLFVAHHLVFDGMSKDLLLDDLASLYGGAGQLPALPYEKAVAVERARADEQLPLAREHWAARWRDDPGLVLPYATGSSVTAAPGAVLGLEVGPLAEAAAKLGATPFHALLTALCVLLHRYGNAEVAVAADLSTRTQESRDRVGLFVNELPVRSTHGGNYRELAARIREETRRLNTIRSVPLARAVSGLSPRAALTPVSVSYRARGGAPVFPGLDVTVDWMMFSGQVRNTVHVQAVAHGDAIDAVLHYNPAILPAHAAARIGQDLRAVVSAIAADPDRLPADAPLPTTTLYGPPPRTDDLVTALFERQARQTPDATAVVFQGSRLSYAELDAAAELLAGRLRARGAGPGALVGLRLGRSAQLPVAVLGVLKTGAAYLPLDPAYPTARLDFVTADSGADLVLGADGVIEGPAASGVVEGRRPLVPDCRGGLHGAGGLAYVIYTSGSTGRPKGVEIEHGSLTNLLLSMRDELQPPPRAVWLGLTSLSFDISVVELLLPLITGGRVVIAAEEQVKDGVALLRHIREHQVSHVQATPSGWRLLLAAGFDEPDVVAVSGGEPLSLSLAKELRGRCGALFNAYGPTETTVWSTLAEVPRNPQRITVGRPLAGTAVRVADQQGRTVADGIVGELLIGGAGVARGYRGRPDLTAERFRTGAAACGDSGRWYLTGDLARLTPDGDLELLGRADDQVKIRGHRVEPGEIEAALMTHGGVTQAVVVAHEDRLVAYAVGDADPRALRDHLANLLPAALVPGQVIMLAALPIAPGGKLDRHALPTPDRHPLTAREAVLTGPVEEVRQIWQEVLRIDDILPDDDLFDLGGHSLTMAQISARIHRRLGVELPLDVFFDTPTVAGVSAAVTRMRSMS